MAPCGADGKEAKIHATLNKLTEYRRALLMDCKNRIDDYTVMREFSFDVRGGDFFSRVEVKGVEGADLFLKFFFVLRSFLCHGDRVNAASVGPCKYFLSGDLNLVQYDLMDKESREKVAEEVSDRILGLLEKCCTMTPLAATRGDEPGTATVPSLLLQPAPDSSDPEQQKRSKQQVANWMAELLLHFYRYNRHVRVSTLLLETKHDFLTSVGRAFVSGLLDDVENVHPRLATPPFAWGTTCTEAHVAT
eukprot:m.708463 g.708463  ORF g.708463 m.708463 type:complete len:248 (+) comp22939_c0_seq1:2411-3154(+)